MSGTLAALPALRSDLELARGPATPDGRPSWTLFDPLRGRYFRLDEGALRLLSAWGLRKPEAVLARANDASGGAGLAKAHLDGLVRFLLANELLDGADPAQRKAHLEREAAARRVTPAKLVQKLLFLRVPLLDPDAWLAALWPWLRPLCRPPAVAALAGMALLGVLLVLREWDRFVATVPLVPSPAGLLALTAAVVLAKTLHELGHAIAAKALGLRVPSMGVALMMGLPMLYTDLTYAWRLNRRRDRMLVDAAGVMVETALGGLALLAWPFLPEGPWR